MLTRGIAYVMFDLLCFCIRTNQYSTRPCSKWQWSSWGH